MQGEVSYRQLVLSQKGMEKLRLPLLAPVNDLLGWLPKGDERYLPYLLGRYKGLGFPRGTIGDSINHAEAFDEAATAATKGQISPSIAEHLTRLKFAPDGTLAEVPDLSAFAAWSLLEALRRQ